MLQPVIEKLSMNYGEIKIVVQHRHALRVIPTYDYYVDKLPPTKK
jgi:hypothetical protein